MEMLLNDLPRRMLREMVVSYGRDIYNEPQRCKSFLLDTCGEYKREINILVTALDERVPSDLLTSSTQVPYKVLQSRFAKRLYENRGLSEDFAQWGVDSWALALGLVAEKDLLRSPETPIPPTGNASPKRRSTSRSFGIIAFISLGVAIVVLTLGVASAVFLQGLKTLSSSDATATAIGTDPYGSYNRLALYDPLVDNSRGYGWAEHSGMCQFTSGAYHISEAQRNFSSTCTAHRLNVSNFAFEVQMKIIQGDCGGLGFRVDLAKNNSYNLQVCANGHYKLLLYVKGSATKMVMQDSVSIAIHTGLQQTNLIAVVATGPDLSLYINHKFVTKGSDSAYTLSSGLIGVSADSNSNPTEVAYSNARVWTD